MTSSAIVTGAAGFIGSHLAEALLARGDRVVGVDSFSAYYDPARKRANLEAALRHERFELVEADLVDLAWEPLLREADAVFHLAAQPGVRASWGQGFATYLQANVLVTQRLLEAVAQHPVPTVFASSSSVYGEGVAGPRAEDETLRPASPYGLTKATAEQLVEVYRRDAGVPVAALRYFSVFGPRQRPDMAFHRFISAAESGEPVFLFGDGEQSRDFTYVADVVDATIRAVGAPSPVYNIGGGSPAAVNDVIGLIEVLTGKPVNVVQVPPGRGDVRETWANARRARDELGWAPRTTLAEGLTAQIEHHRQVLRKDRVA